MLQKPGSKTLYFAVLILVQLVLGCNQAKNEETVIPVSADPKIASLKLPAEFHADHLYSPGIHDQGSWVAMTFDDKGRMIASDQYGNLYRLTIPAIGSDTNQTKIKVDSIVLQLSATPRKNQEESGMPMDCFMHLTACM